MTDRKSKHIMDSSHIFMKRMELLGKDTQIADIPLKWLSIAKLALLEDVGYGDLTTLSLPNNECKGDIIAKEPGVIAGMELAKYILALSSKEIEFLDSVNDGTEVKKGDRILSFLGDAHGILMGERTALNFLQLMSGTATLAFRLVKALNDNKIRILDTRKTIPLMRELQKYAVTAGGCYNHRMGLYDMILVKENHIELAKGIERCLDLIFKNNCCGIAVEVEVRNMKDFLAASKYPVQVIMLDNMKLPEIRNCVKSKPENAQFKIEISGNIGLSNIHEYKGCGVDFISCGALTNSVARLDLSLLLE